jgi:hypothetical protein
MSGIITCYDAKTGKIYWVDRLNGAFSGSPMVTSQHYLIQNEMGVTYVVKPSKKKLIIEYENSITTKTSEIFRANHSQIGKNLFTRSLSKLYCISGN